MTRNTKTPLDRQTSLQSKTATSTGGVSLAGVQLMYRGVRGEPYPCTITGHCRTQVFEFPRISFQSEAPTSHHTIHDSGCIQALVVADLVSYFENTTHNKHYSISPRLRHTVAEVAFNVSSRQKDLPVFVVIHEYNQVESIVMDKGECSIQDEVLCEDGKETAILVGGRRGETFVTAWRATDGRWPSVSNNQRRTNLILAAVRAEQDAVGKITKHIDESCFVTETGRFVGIMKMSGSAQVTTAKSMDAQALVDASSRIKRAIARMEPDADKPHVGLLIDSMYWDKEEKDAELRIRYLSLWQSLVDARKRLGYTQKITPDTTSVPGISPIDSTSYGRRHYEKCNRSQKIAVKAGSSRTLSDSVSVELCRDLPEDPAVS